MKENVVNVGDVLTDPYYKDWVAKVTSITPLRCGLFIRGELLDDHKRLETGAPVRFLIPYEATPSALKISNGWAISSARLPNGVILGTASRWITEHSDEAFYEKKWDESPPVFSKVTSFDGGR